MKTTIKKLLFAAVFIFAFASPVMAVVSPQTVAAAACTEDRFLGVPPWYRGLVKTEGSGAKATCNVKSPEEAGGLSAFIWLITLNVIEMAIVAMTYLAVFFIMYGGFLFMTGGNNPSQIEKGRKTILNAVIGLVICMASIAVTNLIFTVIT